MKMRHLLLLTVVMLFVISIVWSLIITMLISHNLVLAWLSFFLGMIASGVAMMFILHKV